MGLSGRHGGWVSVVKMSVGLSGRDGVGSQWSGWGWVLGSGWGGSQW